MRFRLPWLILLGLVASKASADAPPEIVKQPTRSWDLDNQLVKCRTGEEALDCYLRVSEMKRFLAQKGDQVELVGIEQRTDVWMCTLGIAGGSIQLWGRSKSECSDLAFFAAREEQGLTGTPVTLLKVQEMPKHQRLVALSVKRPTAQRRAAGITTSEAESIGRTAADRRTIPTLPPPPIVTPQAAPVPAQDVCLDAIDRVGRASSLITYPHLKASAGCQRAVEARHGTALLEVIEAALAGAPDVNVEQREVAAGVFCLFSPTWGTARMASLLELSPSTCAHALLRTEATAEELEKVYDRLAITKGSPPSVRMDLAHALYRELPSPWAFQIMLKVLKAAQDVEAEGADALYGLTCEPFEIIVPAAFARACKTLEPASRRGPPAKGKLLAFLLDVLLALILFLAARWLRPHPTKIVYLGKAVGSGAGALVGAFLLITIVRETLGFGPYGAVFILTGATGTLLGFAVGLFASDHVFQDEPQLVFPFVTTLCAVLLPISAFTTSRATGGYALGPVTTMCIMFVLVLGGILSARVRALFR